MISKIFEFSLRELYNYFRRGFMYQRRWEGFSDEHPCIFTLSTGRVGTKTLAALFAQAPNVFAYHEPEPRLYGLSKLSYLYANTSDACVNAILKEAFLLARSARLDFSLSCHKGYIETSPQATFLGPIIAEAVPSVRFIHAVRDPREVIRSGMRRKWYNGHPADKTRITPHEGLNAASQWQSFNSFQKNLWLWAETNDWISGFISALPEDRRLFVHAEDVFCANEEVIGRLFTFAGSPVPPRRKILSILGKKLNAQKTGEFPDASAWTTERYADLQKIAGETARTLGYDL